jgi:hypothetical protein
MNLEQLAQEMATGFEEIRKRMMNFEEQQKLANKRTTELEKWRSYLTGVRDGAGGLWHIVLGALGGGGVVAGVIGLLMAKW